MSDLRNAEAAITAADEAIERINRGLPTGYVVGTYSSSSQRLRRGNVGGHNKIYRPDQLGLYCDVGEVGTEGSRKPFLGNRILKDGDELVVINDELKLGFSVKDEVFVVDTKTDPTTRTLGGSQMEQFEQSLLPLIQKMPRD